MQFVSFDFIAVLPLVALITYFIPQKYRYIWMLVISAAFYASLSLIALPVLLINIVITYFSGIMIDKNVKKAGTSSDDEKDAKSGNTAGMILAAAIVVELGLMLLLRSDRIFNVIGISFFTLKSVGYLVDVYKGKQEAEKDFLILALFVSFFPQVLSGPIDRAGLLIPQLKAPVSVDFDRLRDGFLQMLWGYFLKLVIADRLSIFVNEVYAAPESFEGTIIAIATLFYTFEIYCDFAGYSSIAIGTARLLGIDVNKNFDCPYLSKSIPEFWRRWHISLSSYLKDYVYIPLGGSRKGTNRKYLNILIVFAVSGIWHGSALTFLVWGLLHALYQIAGYLTAPFREKAMAALMLEKDAFSHKLISVLFTFFLVNLAWVFFRASSLSQALLIIRKSFEFTPWVLSDNSLYHVGLSRASLGVGALGILIMTVADIISLRGVLLRSFILKQALWLRWLIMITAILFIFIFGIWGSGYNASSFIYQQF
ncbi:MAG: MBOAT family protein [Butyrivibrio sp.]|nr:MBOAT family protein [Butyrivibrio sp.]